MYTTQIPLIVGMSNSSENSFLIKDDDHEIEIRFENFSPPISNSSNGSSNPPSNQNLDKVQEHQELADQEQETAAVSSTPKIETYHDGQAAIGLGKSEVADDDDGFRTPTSLDQKIPVMSQCPPAPRKSRPPPSRKRKLSPRNTCRTIQIDLSLESMFLPRIQEDLGRKIKKIQRGDGS